MKNLLKISTALIIVLGFTIKSQAQTSTPEFGIKGGINFSNMYTDDVDDENVLTSFNAGVYSNFPVTSFISIQPELLYSRKGSELVYNNAFATGTAKFRLDYVELPVLLKLNLTKNLNVHAGPYFAYLVNAKVTNETQNGTFDFENNYDTNDFQKFDTGISAGIGLDFDATHIGLRYNYGFTPVGKERTIGGSTYTIPDGKNSNLSLYLAFSL
jgi:hypothetical protein